MYIEGSVAPAHTVVASGFSTCNTRTMQHAAEIATQGSILCMIAASHTTSRPYIVQKGSLQIHTQPTLHTADIHTQPTFTHSQRCIQPKITYSHHLHTANVAHDQHEHIADTGTEPNLFKKSDTENVTHTHTCGVPSEINNLPFDLSSF